MPNKKVASASWSPPKQFDEYRILWQLGRGGMGEVYLGQDTLLDRPVAIKFISAINPDVLMREQFLNEARAAARLQHPNVVSVYRVGEIDGHPYIISEFVRGQNLDRIKLPMPWTRALELGIGLARGLAAAHRRGVLHRDIKPGNVIMATEGQVKILDFGLAKFIESSIRDVVEQPETNRLHVTAPTLDIKSAISSEEIAVAGLPTDSNELADTADPVDSSVADKQSRLPAQIHVSLSAVARASMKKPSKPAVSASSDTPPASPSGISDPAERASLEDADTGERPAVPASMVPMTAVDAGLAEHEPARRTSSGIKGTPLYMAPEVLNGEPASRRSDIYSMGALLYELCTGSPPHYDPLMTLADLRRIANNQSASSLSKMVTSVDPRFAAAIERCLHRNPQERFSSGEELRDALEQIADTSKKEEIPEGNPYRGLLPFEAEHRSLFFGRKAEIGTLIDRLRTEAFIVVAADSGVGKSSLCRAGVLPLIAEGALGGSRSWKEITLIPGRRPLQSLCLVLSRELNLDEKQLQDELRQDPANLPRLLYKTLGDKRGLVLFIDQTEELITIGDREETLVVGEALAALITRAPNVRVLSTVRSDFLARLATVPGIGDEINRALYILRPLSAEKIREVITGPAHKKGVSFESEEMLKALVETTAQADGGLPLLQFALAELWEVKSGDVITAQALQSIGGVEGALARHADHVLSRMQAEQRYAARRILMNLVTLEGTRARRIEEELTREGAPAKAALEGMVRGRLLVARDTPDGAAYEVAHEALIKGWGTLRRWLEENAEARAVKTRLEASTAEWLRLAKSRDTLWGARQLAEIALLEEVDIGPKERDFLTASRSAAERSRRIRRAAFAAVPIALSLMYGSVRLLAARDLERRIVASLNQGKSLYEQAQAKDQELAQLRQQAFARFDDKKREEGEEIWAKALKIGQEVDRLYAKAGQSLEGAVSLDNSRKDVRDLMAATLYERAVIADRDVDLARKADIEDRLSIYDTDGSRRAALAAPARVQVRTTPVGARVVLARYEDDAKGRRVLGPEKELGVTPLAQQEIKPGSYVILLRKDGYPEVRYPVWLSRGEALDITVPLLSEKQIPAGFTYIPPGRFFFGLHGQESQRKLFFNTAPGHHVQSPGYFISTHETTYGEYIEYLRTLPKDKQAEALPKVGGGGGSGTVELSPLTDGRWRLTFQPSTVSHTAASDESLVYSGRQKRSRQNWLRLPVGGVSYKLVASYAAWLAENGHVPGARPCTEREWERAARGADERYFPMGLDFESDDANVDETYGRMPESTGPDEVGSHENGRSPFGVHDLLGNVNEWATSSLADEGPVIRGGSFVYNRVTGRVENRNVSDPSYREGDTGIRICADVGAPQTQKP
ncbi:MAG: protein kinase [Myxococcales bacterium]|nr:protein kinase [Myxococcales bacterium]